MDKTIQQSKCKFCLHRKFDADYNGFFCGLTNEAGEFEDNCNLQVFDKNAKLNSINLEVSKKNIAANQSMFSMEQLDEDHDNTHAFLLIGIGLLVGFFGIIFKYLFGLSIVSIVIGVSILIKNLINRNKS